MIIDAHHHFWKFNAEAYAWIGKSMPVLRHDYLPVHLAREIRIAGVGGTLVIQARQNTGETRWLLDLAGAYDFIQGVVGWVDLQSGSLGEQLDEFTRSPWLRGVRHVIHDEPDDDFMLRPSFLRGIEQLGKYGLTYDLLLFPRHLKNAAELTAMFPEQKFVVDHLAKPFIKAGILDPWRQDLVSLASRPNVWCKISGMVTEADWKKWKYEDFIPYLDVVLKAFGPDRIMLGSDWPVCLLAGEYSEILNIPKRYFGGLDPGDQGKIFQDNAIEFYNLST